MKDDTISRQSAMTLPYLPKEYREYITYNLDDAYEKGWDDCQECIKHIPADYTTWIPVSERLPDEFEVICCDDRGNMLIAHPFECSDSDTGYSAESDECYMYNVVAWMPKPKPYKGEE